MQDFKKNFKRPPLTNAEAREMAEATIQNLHETHQALKRFKRVLEYIHPLATPEQQAEMERLLQEPLPTEEPTP